MNKKEIKLFLDEKVERYNCSDFIKDDPIGIPHQFSKKEDIEISSLLTATIAWGQRKTIIKNAYRIIDFMEGSPHAFLMENNNNDFYFSGFVHRTFSAADLSFFLKALKCIYTKHGGLEKAFSNGKSTFERISNFRNLFFGLDQLPPPNKTSKHISNPQKNSAAKRLNMFLRWMVRNNKTGVDFGIWKSIPPADLMLPLDVHTGNVSRKLGLLKRAQNDWKAVAEITQELKKFDNQDPIKYDFALFGLGVAEKF